MLYRVLEELLKARWMVVEPENMEEVLSNSKCLVCHFFSAIDHRVMSKSPVLLKINSWFYNSQDCDPYLSL